VIISGAKWEEEKEKKLQCTSLNLENRRNFNLVNN
jgi:hypothetical protein